MTQVHGSLEGEDVFKFVKQQCKRINYMKKKIEMLRKGPKEHFTGPKKYVFVDKRVVKQQN